MSSAARARVGERWEDYQELAELRGWGDGLPLVPPTPDRVAALLERVDADPATSLGQVPPSWREATVEAVAVNAVMAGCRPEHFPYVLAAVECVLDPVFNLYGIQATTNPVAPLVVVNGPGARLHGFNAAGNAFGPGRRANATVGRALRLVMVHIGDARGEGNDRATHGSPGKFSFCVAEHEEASPWEPFHVERGFAPSATTVTVMGIAQFHNVVEFVATDADDLLDSIAANLAVPGTNNISYGGEPVVVFCPEHAAIVGAAGYRKGEVKRYLFERARCDLSASPPAVREMLRSRRPGWCDLSRWPICDDPDDLLLLVCGGPGAHSLSLPSFGPTTAVTREVRLADVTAAEAGSLSR